MKLSELYTSKQVEKFLFEMANLGAKRTGIERVFIWASPAQRGAERHGARVKVSSNYTNRANEDDFFVLSVEDEPEIKDGECHLSARDLGRVKKWVALNKDALLRYWAHEIDDTGDFIDALKKVDASLKDEAD